MRYLKAITTTVLMMGASSLAVAQGLEVTELSQAQAYEPGAIDAGSGALPSSLWSGTSADLAESLINDLPEYYQNPIARDLARRVLLSPGAPPSGDSDSSFPVTRMNGIIRLSEMAAAQDIAQRSPGLEASDILKADLALLSGNMETACQMSDSVIEGRSDPYWMKLRALCHVQRNEKAAADLTLDLLKNAGEQDPYFERLLRHMTGIPGAPDIGGMPATPLHIAMMTQAGLEWPEGQKPATAAAQAVFNEQAPPTLRLGALMSAGPALSDAQIREVIESFAPPAVDAALAGGAGMPTEPSLDSAMADPSARGFYQLYNMAQTGTYETRVPALIALLHRTQKGGGFERFVGLMSSQLQIVDYSQVLVEDLPLLARAAVIRNDVGALQQIHGALDGNPPAQERIALAADALGNGFFAGNLGTDIDTRLEKPGKRARALRDAMLAHALGANLSDTALNVMADKTVLGSMSGDLFAFDIASDKQAVAETALRAVRLLERDGGARVPDYTLFKVISGLYKAGLSEQAARLAALDFLDGYPG